MKIKINLWSFIFSFVCIALFFIAISSQSIIDFTTTWLNMHPLTIVLGIAIVNCVLGFIGLSEATNWKKLLRGFSTIIITLGLSGLIIFILFMGFMLS
ncbi:hypothetical protein [Clostridium tunisiense]|uniref:hypothetical protein n=1 Tax=Clostridium tunisiense TaxID=219748 RepID=UPI00030D2927|nr:hypothetical protein [Clostridium tunisiense]